MFSWSSINHNPHSRCNHEFISTHIQDIANKFISTHIRDMARPLDQSSWFTFECATCLIKYCKVWIFWTYIWCCIYAVNVYNIIAERSSFQNFLYNSHFLFFTSQSISSLIKSILKGINIYDTSWACHINHEV